MERDPNVPVVHTVAWYRRWEAVPRMAKRWGLVAMPMPDVVRYALNEARHPDNVVPLRKSEGGGR